MERKNNECSLGVLSRPHFAILQGPPGSWKTTAIIELIAQCALQNKRVLLCGSTRFHRQWMTRIISKPNLARLVSPRESVYTKNSMREFIILVLSEQIVQYIELGFSPTRPRT